MNEKLEQYSLIVKLLVLVILATLYAWGGMEMKWLRRFIAPAIATATIFYYSRSWKSFLHFPLWIGASCLGYGASEVIIKILKRALVGAAFGVAGSIPAILSKRWLLVGFITALCVACYVVLGVYNPFNSARIEETTLGLFVYSIPVLMARKEE